jgi:hypothetical protein
VREHAAAPEGRQKLASNSRLNPLFIDNECNAVP